jgi:hypothetical protein
MSTVYHKMEIMKTSLYSAVFDFVKKIYIYLLIAHLTTLSEAQTIQRRTIR